MSYLPRFAESFELSASVVAAMVDPAAQTTQMVRWAARIRAGDLAARDELIRGFQGRLELLARKMLHRNPRIARWADADDLLQNALIRLLRPSSRCSLNRRRRSSGLAAEQMRGASCSTWPGTITAPRERVRTTRASGRDPTTAARGSTRPLRIRPRTTSSGGLGSTRRWPNFRWREREVVGLVLYHGWTQVQVAELFQVDERTIRRWWESAHVRLHRVMKDGDGSRS